MKNENDEELAELRALRKALRELHEADALEEDQLYGEEEENCDPFFPKVSYFKSYFGADNARQRIELEQSVLHVMQGMQNELQQQTNSELAATGKTVLAALMREWINHHKIDIPKVADIELLEYLCFALKYVCRLARTNLTDKYGFEQERRQRLKSLQEMATRRRERRKKEAKKA